jgi:hypothetical protein
MKELRHKDDNPGDDNSRDQYVKQLCKKLTDAGASPSVLKVRILASSIADAPLDILAVMSDHRTRLEVEDCGLVRCFVKETGKLIGHYSVEIDKLGLTQEEINESTSPEGS